MKKIKEITITQYMSVDGYQVTKYNNVDVPDDVEIMSADDLEMYFLGTKPDHDEFIVRKVLDWDPDEATIDISDDKC